MAGTLVVCEHSLHRPRETGAAWIIKVGCERLVRIIKVGSERSVGSEIGSALPREPSLNSIGFVAQFISELFDLTEAVPELVKNSPAFVAICQMSHLVRTPIASAVGHASRWNFTSTGWYITGERTPFFSKAAISFACTSVRPMSSRPFSRQSRRNGSTVNE